jgi:hypothetical protein
MHRHQIPLLYLSEGGDRKGVWQVRLGYWTRMVEVTGYNRSGIG